MNDHQTIDEQKINVLHKIIETLNGSFKENRDAATQRLFFYIFMSLWFAVPAFHWVCTGFFSRRVSSNFL